MTNQILLAKLMLIAAQASETYEKAKLGQHWDRDLTNELNKIAALAKEAAQLSERDR